MPPKIVSSSHTTMRLFESVNFTDPKSPFNAPAIMVINCAPN